MPYKDFMATAQKLTITGSYKRLGYATILTEITDAKVIITLSEAIRFTSVANGINKVLGNESSFSPNLFEIID